jgi:hypothetical protein
MPPSPNRRSVVQLAALTLPAFSFGLLTGQTARAQSSPAPAAASPANAAAPGAASASSPTSAATSAPAAASAAAPGVAALPPELVGRLPLAQFWQVRGSGVLRFFGFKAYDARLWAAADGGANPLLARQPFALDIIYNATVSGEEIARVSLVEMYRLRPAGPDRLEAWNQAMRQALPSVKSGDRLVGVHLPQVGARFYFNGRQTGEVNDPAFSEAFFAIWFDENTRRPELRRALLGG